jgi:hypothetical protein
VYGIPSASVVDETAPYRPRYRKDTYALAKIAAERILQECCRDRGLEAAILQPTMFFGPHSDEWTLAPLAMLKQADLAMAEGDRSICNAVYVDDVAAAAVLAADACDKTCQAYLINGKDLLTWTDYLSRHAAMGTPGQVVTLPQARMAASSGGEAVPLAATNFNKAVARPAGTSFGSAVHALGLGCILASPKARPAYVNPPETDRPERTRNSRGRISPVPRSAAATPASTRLRSRDADPSLQQREGRAEAGIGASILGRYGLAKAQGLGQVEPSRVRSQRKNNTSTRSRCSDLVSVLAFPRWPPRSGKFEVKTPADRTLSAASQPTLALNRFNCFDDLKEPWLISVTRGTWVFTVVAQS